MFPCVFLFCLFFLFLIPLKGLSQSPSLYLDADQSLFSLDGKQKVFIGNVVAVGPRILISADKILFDQRKNLVEASGNALLMSDSHIFTGKSIRFDLFNEDLFIEQAVLVTKDKKSAEKVISDILGFSSSELEYESYRKAEVSRLNVEIEKIYIEALRYTSVDLMPEELKNRLTNLYTRKGLVEAQANPIFARKPEERRNVFERRRKFWKNNRETGQSLTSTNSDLTYIKLKAKSLSRTQGNDFVAEDVMFTPCLCEDDETPSWSINSKQAKAQMGGYLDFYDPHLEIAGVPVLYLPFMKLPLKGQRQSGFLAPNFSSSNESGNIVSTPIYFVTGPNSDLTLYPDFIDKRGTLMGAEYRYLTSESSKWKFRIQTIKDKLWISDASDRQVASNAMITGIKAARNSEEVSSDGLSGVGAFREEVKSRDYWDLLEGRERINDPDNCLSVASEEEFEKCLDLTIRPRLAAPENLWRTHTSWEGVEYFAPRFSYESYGRYYSDHKYIEHLDFPNPLEDATEEKSTLTFGEVRQRLNLDAKDFYLSIGSNYGDYFLGDTPWAGQQVPLSMDISTPMNPLLITDEFRSYLKGEYQIKRIQSFDYEFREDKKDVLDNGNWQKVNFDFDASVFPSASVNTSLFARVERRDITLENDSGAGGAITSHKMGVEFRLPMVGEFKRGDDPELAKNPFYQGSFLRHSFDFGLRYSVRPVVVIDGNYGNEVDVSYEAGKTRGIQTYFAKDETVFNDKNLIELDEDTMVKHDQITFFTDHSFQTFDVFTENNFRFKGDIDKSPKKHTMDVLEQLMEQQRELLLGDGEVTTTEKNAHVPLRVLAKVSYDFLKAEEEADAERLAQEIRERNASSESIEEVPPVPRAWSPFELTLIGNYAGYRLTSSSKYDFAAEDMVDSAASLSLPKFASSLLTFSYRIEDDGGFNSDKGEWEKKITRTRSAKLSTSLWANVNFTALLSWQKPYQGEELHKHIEYLQYVSQSQCWGLSFSREKDFTEDEKAASYQINFNLILGGEEMSLPNMAGAYTSRYVN